MSKVESDTKKIDFLFLRQFFQFWNKIYEENFKMNYCHSTTKKSVESTILKSGYLANFSVVIIGASTSKRSFKQNNSTCT